MNKRVFNLLAQFMNQAFDLNVIIEIARGSVF